MAQFVLNIMVVSLYTEKMTLSNFHDMYIGLQAAVASVYSKYSNFSPSLHNYYFITTGVIRTS